MQQWVVEWNSISIFSETPEIAQSINLYVWGFDKIISLTCLCRMLTDWQTCIFWQYDLILYPDIRQNLIMEIIGIKERFTEPSTRMWTTLSHKPLLFGSIKESTGRRSTRHRSDKQAMPLRYGLAEWAHHQIPVCVLLPHSQRTKQTLGGFPSLVSLIERHYNFTLLQRKLWQGEDENLIEDHQEAAFHCRGFLAPQLALVALHGDPGIHSWRTQRTLVGTMSSGRLCLRLCASVTCIWASHSLVCCDLQQSDLEPLRRGKKLQWQKNFCYEILSRWWEDHFKYDFLPLCVLFSFKSFLNLFFFVLVGKVHVVGVPSGLSEAPAVSPEDRGCWIASKETWPLPTLCLGRICQSPSSDTHKTDRRFI